MADNVDLLAGKIAELVDALAQPTAQAALEASRMEAYSTLASGVEQLVIGIGLTLLGRWLWKRWKRPLPRDPLDIPFTRIGVCGSYVIAGILFCTGAWAWLDPWTWATIAHPELWIAHELLSHI